MSKTGLYTDERTFWHSTGVRALYLPIGDWVEPPSGTYGVDTPESKRRVLNLTRVSGLISKLHTPDVVPATMEDLLRIHTPSYLDRFKAVSDAGGGAVTTRELPSLGHVPHREAPQLILQAVTQFMANL